jgi:secondary thiamine-phosphate synthase enzyme
MKILEIQSQSKEEFIDITGKAKDLAASSNVGHGLCFIYVPHTTAAVTINENADPSVKQDIIATLGKIVPHSLPYSHLEGNSPAHIKASLVGSSVAIMVEEGKLALGTWQGIFFCEFDGPRRRKAYMRILSD